MNKLLEMIGLGEIKHDFSEFEIKLRNRYIKNFVMDAILSIICMYFTITTKYYQAAAIFVLAIIILLLLHAYSVLALLCGKVYCLEGTVISDNKAKISERVLTWSITILGESKVKVRYDGRIYTVPVGHKYTFETDSPIRVYFTLESVTQVSETEYNILSPILVTQPTDGQETDKQEEDKE